MSIEDLKLVDVKDVRAGRGGGGGLKNKGNPYIEYATALKDIIPSLKDELEKKETIRVIAGDIIKEMGRKFETKTSTSLLWGIRYIMFKEGIFLSTGKHKDGSNIYILRKVIASDKLPGTLSEKSEKEKEKSKKETKK